jgi:hypothetical protein
VSDSTVRDLAAALDTADLREVRARRAAEIVAAAGHYRWVAVYEVDDVDVEVLGHTGPAAPVTVHLSTAEGLAAEMLRTRSSAIGPGGEAILAPILGAETGAVIGALRIEAGEGALTGADVAFAENCALALMPLFE